MKDSDFSSDEKTRGSVEKPQDAEGVGPADVQQVAELVPGYRIKSFLWIGSMFLGTTLPFCAFRWFGYRYEYFWGTYYVAYFLFLWSSYWLAKSKGYHGAWGLLGLGCWVGPLILMLAPEKKGKRTESWVSALGAVVLLLCVFATPLNGLIHMHMSSRPAGCDSVACDDTRKLLDVLERMETELDDLGVHCGSRDAVIAAIVDNNALKYMVGPWYGFGGGSYREWVGRSSQCRTLLRIRRSGTDWVIETTALNGRQPQGPNSHHVCRVRASDGKLLPATVEQDVADANDGKTSSWNAYWAQEPCYGGSIIDGSLPPARHCFAVKIPEPCACEKR